VPRGTGGAGLVTGNDADRAPARVTAGRWTTDGQRQVVAGIVIDGERVLLAHRTPQRSWYPDCWDLPGGHVKEGEAPHGALVRELAEELGITVSLPERPDMSYRGSEFVLHVWTVTAWSGEIWNQATCEHDTLRWFHPRDVRQLKMADARLVEVIEQAAKPTTHPRIDEERHA
jgi:8-oxo-dGTP diphosphatase